MFATTATKSAKAQNTATVLSAGNVKAQCKQDSNHKSFATVKNKWVHMIYN